MTVTIVLLVVGSFVSFIALGLVLLHIMQAALTRQLQPLANVLGGEIKRGVWRGVFVQKTDEQGEVRFGVRLRGRNVPPMLYLERPRSLGFHLFLMQNNKLTKTLARLGAYKSLPTGDPLFDERYLVRVNNDVAAREYFRDARHREVINALFEHGFDQVHSNAKGLRVSRDNYESDQLEPAWIQRGLELFAELSK